jgi:hypothetical protein
MGAVRRQARLAVGQLLVRAVQPRVGGRDAPEQGRHRVVRVLLGFGPGDWKFASPFSSNQKRRRPRGETRLDEMLQRGARIHCHPTVVLRMVSWLRPGLRWARDGLLFTRRGDP